MPLIADIFTDLAIVDGLSFFNFVYLRIWHTFVRHSGYNEIDVAGKFLPN